MYLVEGQKEWIVFDGSEPANLRRLFMDVESDHFQTAGKIFHEEEPSPPNGAKGWRGVQNAGEFMFIPGNNPHAVRNLQNIIGWSMNYVDLGNRIEHLREQIMLNKFREVEQMTTADFPHGMNSRQQDLTFGEFKSQRWHEMELDMTS